MLDLQSKLYLYIEKYKPLILLSIKNTEFKNPAKEALIQAEQISKSGQNDLAARDYVLELIKERLNSILEAKDLVVIKDTIVKEYKIFSEKTYNIFPEESRYISYYQMLDSYMRDEDKNELINKKLSSVSGLEEFAELIYNNTYGNFMIENLFKLKLNNIEVHGTRKIIVETNAGVWKTIYNYRYKKDIDIETTSRHAIGITENSDITEKECEKTGIMKNGFRIDIALKPACKEHMMFIKKFDAVNIKSMDDLVKNKTVTEEMAAELQIYADGRANIGFSGGINSGKTVTARAYVGLTNDKLKIGIVGNEFETDWPGLYPDKDIVSLAATEQYSMSDQLIKLLRCNRDCLAIEEARSFEVEQWIEGCTRGGNGGFITLHNIDENDFINNVAWMCLKSGISQDVRIVRYRVASAIDILVRQWQCEDGHRIIDKITEVITVHNNLDVPYILNVIYKRDIKTDTVKKVGNISSVLQEKFAYYNVPYDKIKTIIKDGIQDIDKGVAV